MLAEPRSTRVLLACGVIAGPLLLAILAVDGVSRPGYDPWRHGVSQLMLGERGWAERLVFVGCGLLLAAGTVGFAGVLSTGPGSTWGPWLVGAVAAGLVIAGAFPTDPALGYPPGAAEGISLAGAVHQVGGTLLFAGLTAAPLVLATRFTQRGQRGWAVYSRITGILVVTTAIASGVAYRLVQRGIVDTAPAGLLERWAFLLGFAWVTLVAVHVLRDAATGARTQH